MRKDKSRYISEQEQIIFKKYLNQEQVVIFNALRSCGCRINELKSIYYSGKQALVSKLESFEFQPLKDSNKRSLNFNDDIWLKDFLLVKEDSLNDATIQKWFQRASKKSNIHITPHDLRKTYFTNLAYNGVSVAEIKAISGHKSIECCAQYIDIASKEKTYLHKLGLSKAQYDKNIDYFNLWLEEKKKVLELEAKLEMKNKGA